VVPETVRGAWANPGRHGDGRRREAITPFLYGRWDTATRAYAAASESQRNDRAAATYYSAGTRSPDAVRSGLSSVRAMVLLVAGECDIHLPPACVCEHATLFPHADV